LIAIFFPVLVFTGFLNEAPVIHKTNAEEVVAEFFLTIYKSINDLNNDPETDRFFLYRVTVKNSEALKIKNHELLGARLFVEGELQNYQVLKFSEKNLVIAEVSANKIWFVNPPQTNQLKKQETFDQSASPQYIFNVTKSDYVH